MSPSRFLLWILRTRYPNIFETFHKRTLDLNKSLLMLNNRQTDVTKVITKGNQGLRPFEPTKGFALRSYRGFAPWPDQGCRPGPARFFFFRGFAPAPHRGLRPLDPRWLLVWFLSKRKIIKKIKFLKKNKIFEKK